MRLRIFGWRALAASVITSLFFTGVAVQDHQQAESREIIYQHHSENQFEVGSTVWSVSVSPDGQILAGGVTPSQYSCGAPTILRLSPDQQRLNPQLQHRGSHPL